MRSITSPLTRFVALSLILVSLVTGVAFAVASHSVPFKGDAAGSIVSAEPTSGGVLLTVHASGTATHLGQFQRFEQLLLDPGTGTFTGTILFVAANLDELHVTLAGGFISPTTAIGTYTFVGGTGRFIDVTGNAAFEAVSPDGVQVSVSFDGTFDSIGG